MLFIFLMETIMDFKYREELEDILEKYNVSREDVCLVGSMALSIRGIRNHGDVDFCVPEKLQPLFKKGLKRNYLTENVNLVRFKYWNLLGISDDELVENPLYHEKINGFKIIRLEVEFSAKIRRNWPKDVKDIPLIEKYILNTNGWNWDLVMVEKNGSQKKSRRKKLDLVSRILRLGLKAIKNPLKRY